MAFTATIVGTTVGGLLSFVASRNLMKRYWLYFITRRSLEIARTVPDIVWALIFIYPFGVGPWPASCADGSYNRRPRKVVLRGQ